MEPIRISRGLFRSPSFGRFLLPQDLLVFLLPLFSGFVLHVGIPAVFVIFVLLAGCLSLLRGRGEGYLRGRILFLLSEKNYCPAKADPERQIVLAKARAIREEAAGSASVRGGQRS